MAKNQNGEMLLEQNTAIDDSLLPSAIELEKLKEVDPKIIDWILQRTEIEQNARIKFNEDRVKLAGYDLKGAHRFNVIALCFGFILFLAVLALSGYFIYKGLNVQGTIFGGTVLVVGALFFVKAATIARDKK